MLASKQPFVACDNIGESLSGTLRTRTNRKALPMTRTFGILLGLLTALSVHATDVPPPVDNFFKIV